jgi:hypothetical protein
MYQKSRHSVVGGDQSQHWDPNLVLIALVAVYLSIVLRNNEYIAMARDVGGFSVVELYKIRHMKMNLWMSVLLMTSLARG